MAETETPLSENDQLRQGLLKEMDDARDQLRKAHAGVRQSIADERSAQQDREQHNASAVNAEQNIAKLEKRIAAVPVK
jgi:hypothetical protein